MAIETRIAQKEKLYSLLTVKKAYIDEGVIVLPALEISINYAKAGMDPEDIALIEKQVEGA